MELSKEKLKEKMVLILYTLSETLSSVYLNTYKRYIYLYYLLSSFITDTSSKSDSIDIMIEKGDIKIVDFDRNLQDFETSEYVDIDENIIVFNEDLKTFVTPLIENNGQFCSLYKEIRPFVNLLQSYSDQFVFTIFFSEPTFKDASLRGIKEIQSSSSKLADLLRRFKEKLSNSRIDEYDILAYWMDYILKNYYLETGENCADKE